MPVEKGANDSITFLPETSFYDYLPGVYSSEYLMRAAHNNNHRERRVSTGRVLRVC